MSTIYGIQRSYESSAIQPNKQHTFVQKPLINMRGAKRNKKYRELIYGRAIDVMWGSEAIPSAEHGGPNKGLKWNQLRNRATNLKTNESNLEFPYRGQMGFQSGGSQQIEHIVSFYHFVCTFLSGVMGFTFY